MFARIVARRAKPWRRPALCRDSCVSDLLGRASLVSLFSTTIYRQAPGPPKNTELFAKARFSQTDVPELAFWERMVQPPWVSGLEPGECLQAAHAYVDLAVADQPGWRDSLRSPAQARSRATLHYLAVMIMNGPVGPAFGIALHIYHTLVMLNYLPSVVTVMRLAFMRNKLGQPQFRLAEKQFAALLRRKSDPNACTLQGQILAAKLTPETDKQALEWFHTAALLGEKDLGAWEWQASWALDMGKVYLRLNKPEKARELWKYCAETLDVAEGAWLYSTMLDASDPEKYQWVCKAAVSGVQIAAREMARLEGMKLKTQNVEDMGHWEKKAASVMQREWEAIAGDQVVT
ncbi:hypothetical protein SUNI508_03879 [Seiridium unicorne]|uniref:Uncharacterized protein n=1 Tax=Seiridium unicorne TaxID=138068 RepID=A0ABR2VAC5_9PEZI